MSTIDDLERKVESLKARLADAKTKLRNARLRAAPVKKGDIVRATHRRWEGKLFRVCHVDVRHGLSGKPWVDGNPQRKDGSYGTAVRHLYGGWELAP